MLSTLTVTNTSDTGIAGDGSLRGEIAAAQSGDTIQFAIPTTDPGYNPTTGASTITLGSSYTTTYGQVIQSYEEIPIAKNLTIQGPGANRLTISGGGHSGSSYGSRVFEIDGAAATVTLSGLSITGGNGQSYSDTNGSTGSGGGPSGAPGTASDGQGGAIWNAGVLTIRNCVLSHNSADQFESYPRRNEGGAIYNAGSLTITNSVLSNNSAGDDNPWAGYGGNGGAIYNAGSLAMTGDTLSADSADSGGAVFSAYKASAALTGVSLSGNTADDGGAIWNGGTMTLSGCYVERNTASHAGGGIDNAGRLTIQSACNVTGNSAPAGTDLYTLGTVKISRDSSVGVTGP